MWTPNSLESTNRLILYIQREAFVGIDERQIYTTDKIVNTTTNNITAIPNTNNIFVLR
jgi:hypothetical protein